MQVQTIIMVCLEFVGFFMRYCKFEVELSRAPHQLDCAVGGRSPPKTLALTGVVASSQLTIGLKLFLDKWSVSLQRLHVARGITAPRREALCGVEGKLSGPIPSAMRRD